MSFKKSYLNASLDAFLILNKKKPRTFNCPKFKIETIVIKVYI